MPERDVHPTDWLVDIHPHRPPTQRARGAAERARESELIGLWNADPRLTGNGSDDYEDTLEEAARLDAAVTAFEAESIWFAQHWDGTMVHATSGTIRPVWEGLPLRRYGGQPQNSTFPELLTERTANEYASFDTFQRHAGRPVILAGAETDTGADLWETIRYLAAAGHRRQFIKVNTQAKYAAQFIDVPDDPTNSNIYAAFGEGLYWSVLHLEGVTGAYQVQPYTQMRYEYRLFIVDGRPVTGAGCVEEHTPVDHRDDPFDTRVREHRRERSEVVDRPILVGSLVQFGAAVAAELAIERPDLPNYGLDVAVDQDGRPLVVEINGLLNCGLYAPDPRHVTKALAARPLNASEQDVFDPIRNGRKVTRP